MVLVQRTFCMDVVDIPDHVPRLPDHDVLLREDVLRGALRSPFQMLFAGPARRGTSKPASGDRSYKGGTLMAKGIFETIASR